MSVAVRILRNIPKFMSSREFGFVASSLKMHRSNVNYDPNDHNPYEGWGGGNSGQDRRRFHQRGGRGRGRGGYRHSGPRERHTDGAEAVRGRGGRGRGGRGRPPGLKGKEIGLWYAAKSKKVKQEQELQNRKMIHMDEQQIGEVRKVLCSAQSGHNMIKSEPGMSEHQNEDSELLYEAQSSLVPSNDDSWFESPILSSKGQNEWLKEETEKKEKDPHYRRMQEFRKTLPAYEKKVKLMELINSEQVIVISGETGCGKTTQVPQFILDDAIMHEKECKIVCTQPRRISAISVAERVADERAERCGQSCGYQIRLDYKLPRPNSSILYCTTGILLQWLKSDKMLRNVSHIVLDEIHERDLHTDFLLTIVREIIEQREDLKVILMSATLNAELFSSYFNDCPCFHIPGFTYPVQSIYLEEIMDITKYYPPDRAWNLASDIESMYNGDLRRYQTKKLLSKNIGPDMIEKWESYATENLEGKFPKSACDKFFAMHAYTQNNIDPELIVATIKHIVYEQPKGAILVFVPGWMDIKAVNDELLRDRDIGPSKKFLIIPLHSLMPTTNQRQVFDRPPPGVTKIIIATNIAETSITIDDVVHVIDTGKIKITNFDHVTNMGSLQMQWISRANAKQRRGRAGRVQDGFCYHLYTKLQEQDFDDFLLPEMLRTPLDQLCLQIRVLKFGRIEEFLSKVLEPPSVDSIQLSIQKLIGLSAMDADQNLTPLGYHLAKLPVEPQIGKMILMAAIFSCLDPVLTIAANLSFKDPFVVPLGKEKDADRQRKELANGFNSDHIMLLNAFNGWEKARSRGYREENEYCWNYFLTKSTLGMLKDMKNQFAQNLNSIGFTPSTNPKEPAVNKNSKNMKVVTAIVCAGLYPNISKIVKKIPRRSVKLQTKTERKLDFHPKSVNCDATGDKFKEQWLCYYLKMKTTGIYLFDTSEVTAYPLLFFGGNITTYYDHEMKGDVIAVDDWIKFKSKPHIAELVQDLRKALDGILERKIRDPSVTVLTSDDASSKVLSSIVDLITTEY